MDIIRDDLGQHNSYVFSHVKEPEAESTLGELRFDNLPDPLEINSPPFCTIEQVDNQEGKITIKLEKGGKMRGNISIQTIGKSYHISLFSAPAYFAVISAIDGRGEQAIDVLNRYYGDSRLEWEFRTACRATLQYEAFITTMDELAEYSGQFENVMYRSATGYFAKRIDDRGPQGINSYQMLKDRVDQWNRAENLTQISINDILAEYLGRGWIHNYLTNERERLQDIGFNPTSYDPSWNTIVPASWIAHLLLTEGEDAARDYIKNRLVPHETSYGKLSEKANNANEDRWKSWGDVVAVTGSEAEENFHYATYQYLRFAGTDYHGNAKINPMLYSAATTLTGPLPEFFHQRIRFEEQISLGHEYRRDKNWQAAQEAFQNAKVIATGESVGSYDFDRRKVAQAKKSLGHIEATVLAIDNDIEAAIEKYQTTISDLRRLENDPDVRVQQYIDFLEQERDSML
ncbi:hypothetical protein [Natranaeroarchaeum aerophilus]|uniref:Uncharacterized protein n=1 Tax=Natranaeroarchaeum aerophilus TaxID=2917711 RepID=A0AAE3K4G0_9EURY|nr:hypothetical protein [Natranaeroarchaeum aerophilus]MCL9812605.1 hypothetical protein [Natranaeroarchaeum aerophilus]